MVVPLARAAVVAELLPDIIRLSIIIPVLNEAACLDQSLKNLFAKRWVNNHCEVIISDGGSSDESMAIAARYPCRIVRGNRGRARQMNHAASIARGKTLLFLHADSHLPEAYVGATSTVVNWGFFNLRLSGEAWIYRIIEAAINLRTRISRVAGGDQGLYFNRSFFESLGGYPQIPLMEDIAISKAARRQANPVIIDAAITSSSRRWQDRGVAKTILLMWSLRFCYWLGVNPARLHKYYYPERG